jgi:RNA polymerase sigma-70 factor (ECF subfamily)
MAVFGAMTDSPAAGLAPDPTSDLLDRARAGDDRALAELFERHLPRLKRWASGRLPRWARDIADTSDLVQDTMVMTLRHLDGFEHRGDGALQAYLRQAIVNRVRSELRKRAFRGFPAGLDSQMSDHGTSPLDRAMANESLERYDAGLEKLTAQDRDAIVARLELGLSYGEIAERLGKPNANAARMAVVRAIERLTVVMNAP